jgi:CDP-4-dehydro-6-deoxyglucose reductase, E1
MRWSLMDNAVTDSDKLDLVRFILTSDRYTNGPKVREFEQEWSNWLGSKYSLMVSSGSTANFLLVAAVKEKFGLKNGDKVLLPACTWVTNVSPVFQLGLQPVFCDVNIQNFSFDIEHMLQIREHHPDIKMIFVSHLLGFSAETERYKEIFPQAIIIDDICESHGCLAPDGKRRGADSLGATFSFYFGHHMTTVEGGMVSTNDPDLYELMRMKRSHGLARESGNLDKYKNQHPEIHPQFLFMTDGYNFRSSDINAVLGLSQLKRLDDNIQIRRENFAKFVSIISEHADKFYQIDLQQQNSNFCFPFIAKEKETISKLKLAFDNNNVEHRPVIGGNLLRQPFLKGYDFGATKETYTADLINDHGLYIGNSQFVGDEHLNLLSNILKNL